MIMTGGGAIDLVTIGVDGNNCAGVSEPASVLQAANEMIRMAAANKEPGRDNDLRRIRPEKKRAMAIRIF